MSIFFQINVSKEQVDYTNNIVDYSLANHTITDAFAIYPEAKNRQRELRFTGSLGEVVFADAYQLARPAKSFGAADGQDNGKDFILDISGKPCVFDVKTMNRKSNNLYSNYALNLEKYQLEKKASLTDCYYCISLHKQGDLYIASFVGYVERLLILNGKVGELNAFNGEKTKADGSKFTSRNNTYEVAFRDLKEPLITSHIESLSGFKRKKIY